MAKVGQHALVCWGSERGGFAAVEAGAHWVSCLADLRCAFWRSLHHAACPTGSLHSRGGYLLPGCESTAPSVQPRQHRTPWCRLWLPQAQGNGVWGRSQQRDHRARPRRRWRPRRHHHRRCQRGGLRIGIPGASCPPCTPPLVWLMVGPWPWLSASNCLGWLEDPVAALGSPAVTASAHGILLGGLAV